MPLSDVGGAVRYRGIGAGMVEKHVERDFLGTMRIFAVIDFPHRDMRAQVPLGDPATEHKLAGVLSAEELRELISMIRLDGSKMLRTWEEREKVGSKRLKEGVPAEWAEMLRDYAQGQREGMQLAVSDVELIRSAQEMLAAELTCALCAESGEPATSIRAEYTEIISELRLTYGKAAIPGLEAVVA